MEKLQEIVEEIKKQGLKNCFIKIKLDGKSEIVNVTVEQNLFSK